MTRQRGMSSAPKLPKHVLIASTRRQTIRARAADVDEHARAEARFRRYFELPLIGMAITSSDKRFVEVNQKLCDMLGRDRNELIGKSWVDITHPDDIAENVSLVEQTIAGKVDGYSMDKRFIRPDGSFVYTHISARCVRRTDRTIDQFVLAVQDISQRKRAEDQLRLSEASLRQAQRIGQVGSYEYALPYSSMYWSQELYRIVGFHPTEAPPSPEEFVERIVHPDDQALVASTLREEASPTGPLDLEYRVVRPDGIMRYVRSQSEVFVDEGGRPIKRMGVLHDITERVEARLALEAEIVEHRRAEQVARAHTAAIASTLRTLTSEPTVDAFLDQLLKTIVDQMGGMGGCLWMPDREPGTGHVALNYHMGRFERDGEVTHPGRFRNQPLPYTVARFLESAAPIVLDSQYIDTNPEYARFRSWAQALGVKMVLALPLLFGDASIGMLSIRFDHERTPSGDDLSLASALAQQATLAVQLARLSERAEHSAILQERTRIAREIHDNLAQCFSGIVMQVEAFEETMTTQPAPALDVLERIKDIARMGATEARRSIHALRPAEVERRGLARALEELARQADIEGKTCCEFSCEGPVSALDAKIEDELFSIAQEALGNACRHSGASLIDLRLSYANGAVTLCVDDNGRGLDLQQAAKESGGFGLKNMRARSAAIGGRLSIHAVPEFGTSVMVRVPTGPGSKARITDVQR